jgi:hypothetical protein
MHPKAYAWILFALVAGIAVGVVLGGLFAADPAEKVAGEMYLNAQNLKREGKEQPAKEIEKWILSRYPETKIAQQAKALLHGASEDQVPGAKKIQEAQRGESASPALKSEKDYDETR